MIAIAKAPYIHESDSSSLVLLQTDKLEKLFTLQNVANLQGIGFTPEKYVALLDDRWLMCISQWTQTRDKVFYKLLMSFQKQKKLLGLQRNQIFN